MCLLSVPSPMPSQLSTPAYSAASLVPPARLDVLLGQAILPRSSRDALALRVRELRLLSERDGPHRMLFGL